MAVHHPIPPTYQYPQYRNFSSIFLIYRPSNTQNILPHDPLFEDLQGARDHIPSLYSPRVGIKICTGG